MPATAARPQFSPFGSPDRLKSKQSTIVSKFFLLEDELAVGDSFPRRKRIGNECTLGRFAPFDQAVLVLRNHNHGKSPPVNAMVTGCFHGQHREGLMGFV